MILLLDTSTPICKLGIHQAGTTTWHEWQADRTLARGLLAYIRDTVSQYDTTIHGLKGIAVMRGPGSFTGLRIGITVMNTLADSLSLPIIGETGEEWSERALRRLADSESDSIVLPEYGSAAHITKPRK